MSLLAKFHFFIGSYRRKRGWYDSKTLSHLLKANSPTAPLSHQITCARFQRDLEGLVSAPLIEKLRSALNQDISETKRSRIEAILSEANKTHWVPPHKLADRNEKIEFNLESLYQDQEAWRDQLLVFLNGKSIAVVGNSASLLNSNLKRQIDKHEIVCRFNRYPTDSASQDDVGIKTNIWITSAEVLNENRQVAPSVHWIVISGGDARYTLSHWEACIEYLARGIRVITIPLEEWTSLVVALQAPPSAGLLWLKYLSSMNTSKHIQTFGFDTTTTMADQYHITSAKMKRSSRHAWAKEKALLADLEANGDVVIYKPTRYAAFTRGLIVSKTLKQQLQSSKIVYKPNDLDAKTIQKVVGWGRKPNTKPAIAYAKKHNLPFVSLEDGFIHSMSQGRLGADSWSMVVDKTGIYYDAAQTSDLEKLISTIVLTTQELARAKAAISTITSHHITKYNNASLSPPGDIDHYRNPVLIFDQVAGDMSIPFALANTDTFQNMLSEVIAENPNSDILIKRHPDVINGKRTGCIELPEALPKNVHLINSNINPLVLMKYVDKVYVVSSQAGFEALLLGKKVICFGAPFYAGWGLTSDRFESTLPVVYRRKHRPDIYSLFFAAYIAYSRYLDPMTHKPCEIEAVLNHVKRQYKYFQLNNGLLLCIGLTPWKKKFITHYLQSNDNSIHFIKSLADAKALNCNSQSKLLIWSNRHEKTAREISAFSEAKIHRIEDGFLRSVNLGSNYAPPSSLVIDSKGIYFDPSTESDLESILNNASFDPLLLERANKLRNTIISLGISKYNLQQNSLGELTDLPKDKKVILVPGQVSDDASIELGCVDIKTNLDLLKTVRSLNKDAYIIYKPHPDVVSTNRKGSIPTDVALKYCDIVIENRSITTCIEIADEVHTLTSLVGYEALLRNITVHCYGIPFYSGWGLTHDKHQISRRKRSLSINELTAATLILYPRYVDWDTHSYANPEQIANTLHAQSLKITDRQASSFLAHKLSLSKNLLRALLKPTFG